MRLAVFCDYRFWRIDDRIWTERAFILFLGGLAEHVDRLVIPGRLDPDAGSHPQAHYRLPDGIDFVPLPWYRSLAHPAAVARALVGSPRRFWRVLDDVDAVWLLGPHPACFVFAALALLRGRRVALGVRQDLPSYTRTKHPTRRLLHVVADLMEGGYRLLARRLRTVVVGPDLAHKYRHARRLLPISVSLIRQADVPDSPPPHDWEGAELTALSVGRLEAEKNPLLLADVLLALRERDPRWRLAVCGEGPLADDLAARLAELGVADAATLHGYVRVDDGLLDLYRQSNALLHVSWTEGVPQILFEAFAAGLPAVATAVGGVPEATDGAALLVPPGDADAAAAALDRLAADPALRDALAAAGIERLRSTTLERETAQLAGFLAG